MENVERLVIRMIAKCKRFQYWLNSALFNIAVLYTFLQPEAGDPCAECEAIFKDIQTLLSDPAVQVTIKYSTLVDPAV